MEDKIPERIMPGAGYDSEAIESMRRRQTQTRERQVLQAPKPETNDELLTKHEKIVSQFSEIVARQFVLLREMGQMVKMSPTEFPQEELTSEGRAELLEKVFLSFQEIAREQGVTTENLEQFKVCAQEYNVLDASREQVRDDLDRCLSVMKTRGLLSEQSSLREVASEERVNEARRRLEKVFDSATKMGQGE